MTARRLLPLALIGVLLIIAVIAATIYAFGIRSGRYQVTSQGRALVVLDTATGLFWVYERKGARDEFRLVQAEPPVGFMRRVLPPEWLDDGRLIGEGELVPGTNTRLYSPSYR